MTKRRPFSIHHLTAKLLIALILFAGLPLSVPVLALECANAGAVPGTSPDDTGDGDATACGSSAIAGGDDSTALGIGANSSGEYSTALGNFATAPGFLSIALGPFSNSGDQGTALGPYANSGGASFSTALGHSASASGENSAALGTLTSSSGVNSAAVGYNANSSGDGSIALGQFASSGGVGSTALGTFAYTDQPWAIVLGSIADVNGAPLYTDVAIGTTTPMAPLHVTRKDGTAQILVEETKLVPGPQTLFILANPGNTKFEIMNTEAMNSWAFTNSGEDFRVSLQDSGVVEFSVDNFGNAYVANDLEIGGTFTTNLNMPSDISLKQNIETIDADDVLQKVAALPVQAWEYSDKPGQRHIGPMAQDFRASFGLGADDKSISVVDASGVALASIKALETRNRKLEQRVEQLEALVTQLLPKVAQN